MSGWIARWGPVAAVVLLVVVGSVRSTQPPGVVVGSVAVAVLAAVTMRPANWWLLPPALVAGGAAAVICSGLASNLGWFSLCVLAGWCTIQAGTAVGVTFSAATIILLGIQWAGVSSDPGWATWMAGTLFTTLTCGMARRQRELLTELSQAQSDLAERARTQERLRISRELHDVIAHSLTVSLLHVSSARLTVTDAPQEAAAALAEAERLGRQSLTEVRQAVGLLRAGDGVSVAPMPGTAQLPELVEGFRRAGVQISYQVDGDLSGLTATAALTLYRILQEALTNAARHAPAAGCSVRIEVSSGRIELLVDSPGIPAVDHVEGIGLNSMRERAQSVGGMLAAGPSPHGWRVRAVLPTGSSPIAAGPLATVIATATAKSTPR